MDILSKLVENLNYLISEKEITGKQLANELNLTQSSVSHYRTGSHTPPLRNIIKFADYFSCSVDFLLGLEEERFNQHFKPCPPIPERMAALPKLFGMSAYRFCREVNISDETYYEWKSGSSEPNIYSIIKIANHFERSVDFIIGRES